MIHRLDRPAFRTVDRGVDEGLKAAYGRDGAPLRAAARGAARNLELLPAAEKALAEAVAMSRGEGGC